VSTVAPPSVAQAGAARRDEAIRAAWPGGRRLRSRAATLPAWLLTAALGLLYVLLAPASSDLAAAGYRSDLFSRVGFTLWDNGWFAGHHLLAYSLLAPPLGALLGPQALGALSMTAATGLFTLLVRGQFTLRGERVASLWFAFGAGVELFTNRIPFELGLAIGIGALLTAQRSLRRDERPRAAIVLLALTLSALCPLASPVAGAFLALAALAWALGAGRRLALACAALLPIVLLAVAFPEGGSEPFVASAFYPTLAAVLLLGAGLRRRERVLRRGVWLYALALIACYALPTPIGGNVDRLGALLAGPLLAGALIAQPAGTYVERKHRSQGVRSWLPRGWRAPLLLALAPLLLYWQVKAPIADYSSGSSDRATASSYYKPLLGELRGLGVEYGGEHPARVEVPSTHDHGEARWVADVAPLARGWERQLDVHDDSLFYGRDQPLTAARYRAWLSQNAVAYVALADAPADYSARTEARLIEGGVGYLREVWSSRHWRLFAVLAPTPLAQPPSTLTSLGADSFVLHAPRAGTFGVRVHFTPYWSVSEGNGCVQRDRGGFTEVRARAAGTLRVGIDFSLARVFEHGARCS
jgi:hypothetical protein